MTSVRLEPAAPRSRVKQSTTEPLRSGVWGDQCIIFRDQGAHPPPPGGLAIQRMSLIGVIVQLPWADGQVGLCSHATITGFLATRPIILYNILPRHCLTWFHSSMFLNTPNNLYILNHKPSASFRTLSDTITLSTTLSRHEGRFAYVIGKHQIHIV